MKKRVVIAYLIITGFMVFLFGSSITIGATQDRYTLKTPNGISFSEIKGYETWRIVAPSYRTDKNEIRVILGNTTLITAYASGVPKNGKPFPDGSILVKIAHSEKKMAEFPPAIEPDILQRVEFMIKDTKRFAETAGWGYARFVYDATSDTFRPYGNDSSFVQECHQCHNLVKGKDYVFTSYPQR